MKEKLLESQRRDIDQLQNQINLLKSKNTEKEKLIKKIDNELKGKRVIEEVEVDESTLQESIESVPNVPPTNSTLASDRCEIFVKNSLKHLEDMELDIKKSRKISIIREKYSSYCDKVVEELQKNEIKSAIYIMALEKLKDFMKTPVEEFSKELCLQSVDKCRKLLIS